MKKCLFVLMLLGLWQGVTSFAIAQSTGVNKLPEFLFKKGVTFDMEDVPEGPVATHVFEFTNAGKAPLVIADITSSCGCAVADWTKEPVLPGKKGIVSVQYMTNGRVGPFSKDLFIRSNVKTGSEGGPFLLHIKGVVQPKDPERPATGYR